MECDRSIEVLRRAGSAAVADVFDALGEPPPVLSTELWSVAGPGTSFAGPAYTVAGASSAGGGTSDPHKLAAIDAMPAGCVALWAGGDIRGVCCFGDLLATAMGARGVRGVVVDGGVRDVAFLRALDLPILTRYATPAQAIGRWRVTAVQAPVRLRGALTGWVTVAPGDAVVADDDGVVCVPAARLEAVVAAVSRRLQDDRAARDDIAAGMSLGDALAKYGAL